MRHCAVHSSSMHEGRGLGRVNSNGGDLWNGNTLGVRPWSARGTRACASDCTDCGTFHATIGEWSWESDCISSQRGGPVV